MIISGGVNIYPAEIECDAAHHARRSATSPCSASPTRTGARRSRPSSQPADGVEPDDALRDEIFAFCEDNLAKFKRPKTIDFIVEMPRDPNGKLYKRKLRDPYWEGKQRQI